MSHAFGVESCMCQLQLHVQLQELHQGDGTVTEYLRLSKNLAHQLVAAGYALSSAEFNAISYRNLNPEFQSTIAALSIRPQLISLFELHSQLVGHKFLIQNSHVGHKQYAHKSQRNLAANMVRKSQNSSRRSQGSSHSSKNYNGHRQFSRNNNGEKCQICGFTNHTADRCCR